MVGTRVIGEALIFADLARKRVLRSKNWGSWLECHATKKIEINVTHPKLLQRPSCPVPSYRVPRPK